MEGQRSKNLVLSEWEFRVQKGVNQFMINNCMKKKSDAIFKNNETLSSNSISPLSRRQSSASLLSELKYHI
jgi:hypothetical protein